MRENSLLLEAAKALHLLTKERRVQRKKKADMKEEQEEKSQKKTFLLTENASYVTRKAMEHLNALQRK